MCTLRAFVLLYITIVPQRGNIHLKFVRFALAAAKGGSGKENTQPQIYLYIYFVYVYELQAVVTQFSAVDLIKLINNEIAEVENGKTKITVACTYLCVLYVRLVTRFGKTFYVFRFSCCVSLSLPFPFYDFHSTRTNGTRYRSVHV